MNVGRILVAGSAVEHRKELRSVLELESHEVSETETTEQTLQAACSGQHDLLLVDSDIEGLGSYQLCRTIRSKSDLGIIVVDRDQTEQSRIDALNAGADDYVATPFVVAELQARVRAILRRVTPSEAARQLVLQDRAIDLKTHKIRGPGDRVSHLTPKEFLVLEQLVSSGNKSLTHQNLAQAVWQRDGSGEVEYMRIVIKQLRRKLEPDPENPRYILTDRAVGYRLDLSQPVHA
jgi:two-component system, OmpR family, KDP operon response regulator KdpE